jgi:tetrahydromethanopterin S-methyltransferase subunit A
MMANLISNPNIRFLVLCGSEVQGHITGNSIESLHANGIDPERRSIVGSKGAIPYIENIPDEGIERFQQQLELISMIDNENPADIQAKIKECIEKDPGAFEEEALVIKVEEGGAAEEEGEAVPPITPETALIEARMRNIQTQVKATASLQRIFAGMYTGKVQGIMVGLAFTLVVGTLLLLNGV